MTEPKVYVAIPSVDGWIHSALVQSLMSQLKGRKFAIILGQKPVSKARNEIVKAFLESDCTHLFMADADTIIPQDAIDSLLAIDMPIASGVTPMMRGNNVYYNIFQVNDEKETLDPMASSHQLPDSDRMTVQAVGSSCILIRRDVFEKMGESPWYFDTWTQADQYISEDIMFCNIAREAGFSITVNPKVLCKHAVGIVI